MSSANKIKIRERAEICGILLLVLAFAFVADLFSSVDRYFYLDNGFVCSEHARRLHTAPVRWVTLEYHPPTGPAMVVWPSVSRAWEKTIQISNHTAVLVGYSPETRSNSPPGRLIGFEAPAGPPTDISEQVLRKWCGQQGVEPASIVEVSFGSIARANDVLLIEFRARKKTAEAPRSRGAITATVVVPWKELAALIEEVQKGVKPK